MDTDFLKDIPQMLVGVVPWLLVSIVIVVPLMLSVYVIVTPVQKLNESWQSFRMSRSRRSLKDRHFRGLSQKIRYWKMLSVVILAASAWALYVLYSSFGAKGPN